MNIEVGDLGKIISKAISKYHFSIFLTIVGILLAYAVYLLYVTFSITTESPTTVQTSTLGQFDKDTVKKIKELHDSTNADVNMDFPTNRISPFAE
jgi:hypothetical protein